MKIKTVMFSIIGIGLIVVLCFTLFTTENKVGLYGFLVDDYSGNSIECIAYVDEEEQYITKILTKHGTVDFEFFIEYDQKSNSYEKIYADNEFHSLGHTLDSSFTFNISRDAYESDVNRIKAYKDLQAPYYLSYDSFEYTLHLSNCNCSSYGEKSFYVPNYDVAVLFRAGMCDKCFPEMY